MQISHLLRRELLGCLLVSASAVACMAFIQFTADAGLGFMELCLLGLMGLVAGCLGVSVMVWGGGVPRDLPDVGDESFKPVED